MNVVTIPDPVTSIDANIKAFDDEPSTALAEASLRELIAAFPRNTSVNHVLLKMIAINRLYRARVLDKDMEPLAAHIANISDLDQMLASGMTEAVTRIYDSSGTERKYYSFATKFCSWHNQNGYSLWDYNVDEALWAYKKRDSFADFKRQDLCEYPRLIEIVKEFRAFYGLQQYSVKNTDKFLWRIGGKLLEDHFGRDEISNVDDG
jgi:hypothetical protein